jgi:hypothetical protein
MTTQLYIKYDHPTVIKYDHPTVITLLLSLPHILGLKGETVVLQQSRPVGLKI